MENNNTTKTIATCLKQLGVPASILGYDYLKCGIYEVINDGTLIHKMTKRLYPLIADKCDTTASSVERAIRHAIETSFARGKFDDSRNKLYEHYFGQTIDAEKAKLTNSEFIAAIAEAIRFDISCTN